MIPRATLRGVALKALVHFVAAGCVDKGRRCHLYIDLFCYETLD